ncbi:MAG: tetratricopeptide repeat protein [Burkholderiaceae bacterium]|nr:tetratricopeptide repeat protein [Burkholderiaceae bacterium]
MQALHEQGRYEESLDLCLQIIEDQPHWAAMWGNAATNCIMLGRWQDAIGYAQTALARGANNLVPYDALASAHGALGQWDEARRYGLQALNLRVRRFGGDPVDALPGSEAMPPAPSASTRERNVIAFSLFGGNSKYCEPAILNAQEQPRLYPHWVCRFYIDDSVPGSVVDRLRAAGAQIVCVDASVSQWPGPMWRFLAMDDPHLHRVLFRDADSVISRREADAVQQWIASGKRFHIMRDWGSHTELMLAGLWGMVSGSLPPPRQLIGRFMSAPIESKHFADQYFLRQYVWPYACTSLMQHDSIFGFLDAVGFPDGQKPSNDFHVGSGECRLSSLAANLPNGLEVTWQLDLLERQEDGQVREQLVCAYPGIVENGVVNVYIPARYRRRIDQGTACVRLIVPKSAVPDAPAKQPLLLDPAFKRLSALMEQGAYRQALDICLEITGAHPEIPAGWSNAAINCGYLGRWQDAAEYAQTALARGGNELVLCDVLAHAYGVLGQWEQVRRYGVRALEMRDHQFGGDPVMAPPEPGPMPPVPSAHTRERNIIAFSLFGRDSRYCEPAILNVQQQPRIYPHWVCRFYVDASVPEAVISRLHQGGAQIVPVEGGAAQWPGPMWRLLALDDPFAHRVLFRDADAVISQREAAAVAQWIDSGKRFHVMRDWGSHTELILAGLWGVVAGSLPPLERLMNRFMAAPLESRRFADQHFLRQYVWPYARASLMQHDSVFGFMGGVAFADGQRSDDFHVGCAQAGRFFTFKSDLPDGAEVTWALVRLEKQNDGHDRQTPVCSYTNTVQNGIVKVYVPQLYRQWLEQGTAYVRLVKS